MPLSLNEPTKLITVPKDYLTLIAGTLYELDTEQFRVDMNDIMDNERYIWMDDYATRNAPVTVAGTTLAQSLEIINGYSIEFDDTLGAFSVRLVGSNNNLFDIQNGILVQNLVQVIPTNAAGLIIVTSGSGVTAQDKTDIINGVWNHTTGQTVALDVEFIKNIEGGKWEIISNQMIFYKADNTTEVARFDLFDLTGTPTNTDAYKRTRV